MLTGLADQAATFATEAAKETLRDLTPHRATYKTNSGFKVGRRVILEWFVEANWNGGGFRPSHTREAHINAIDGTFHILDSKGLIRDRRGLLATAIDQAKGTAGARRSISDSSASRIAISTWNSAASPRQAIERTGHRGIRPRPGP